MAKPTTIKDAIKRWEEKHPGQGIAEAEEETEFIKQYDREDYRIGWIEELEDTIFGKKLHKSICWNNTLEELWILYNLIEKIKGIGLMKKLKVLYMSNNLVKEWGQFNLLQQCSSLEDLLFVGNPLYDNLEVTVWKNEAIRRLPTLKQLDGEPVLREGDEE